MGETYGVDGDNITTAVPDEDLRKRILTRNVGRTFEMIFDEEIKDRLEEEEEVSITVTIDDGKYELEVED